MNEKEIIGVIFIIEYNGRFLLEQRDDGSRLSKWSWVIPGGSKDSGEQPADTVVREAKEEFGINLDINTCKKITTITNPFKEGSNEIWYSTLSKLPKPLIVSESGGAGWFTLDEINKMELGYSQSEFIIDVMNSV